MLESISHRLAIPNECAHMRLDRALTLCLPDYSRNQLQSWIEGGHIRVDGAIRPSKMKVKGGELITLTAQSIAKSEWSPKPLPLSIIYEDQAILIINKPPDCVVHPAPGHPDDTLVNALLHHEPELNQLPRAGLIHRLDKDTSGLLVIAKTLETHGYLVHALKQRSLKREYLAIVSGHLTAGGTLSAPIGRHPKHRKRMAVIANGKPAITHYRVLERFMAHTLLHVTLESGRTHQIRLHLSHHHHPILGDPLYGGRPKLPPGADQRLIQILQTFKRQALHAFRLSFQHPESHKMLEWEIDCPDDMQEVLLHLRTAGT